MITKFWCAEPGFFCSDGINKRVFPVPTMTIKEWNESLVDSVLSVCPPPMAGSAYSIEASTSAFDIIKESVVFKQVDEYLGNLSGRFISLNKSLHDCVEVKSLGSHGFGFYTHAVIVILRAE